MGIVSDEFRDAVADVVASASGPGWWGAAADAVLAMPEMQAVRLQFLHMANDLEGGCNDHDNHGSRHPGGVRWWASDHLPSSVLDWVFADARTRCEFVYASRRRCSNSVIRGNRCGMHS